MASDASQGLAQDTVAVLMVPFPLQGHLNQLLQLSRLISSHGIPVHFAASVTHARQARHRATHGPNNNSAITFHEFPSLGHQSPLPDPDSTTRFPAHLQPMMEASLGLRAPMGEILHGLCDKNRRVVIIHDSLMGSVVQDFVRFSNAEAYTFHSVSAFSIFLFLWESSGRPFGLESRLLDDLPSLDGCFTPEFEKFVRAQYEFIKLNSGRIYNTCRVIEGPFLELLERPEISQGKKQWALGPFNPIHEPNEPSPNSRHVCLKWLDGIGPNSAILVSFGTSTTFSREQIQELAMGLERSEQNFVWVLRDADVGNIFNGINNTDDNKDVIIKSNDIPLPEGFEERVKGRGIIVRDWAPQLEILGHVAVGGFMSHCGWNSCMESISMGVPMAAWPMHSDQPRNAVLVTKVLGVGITVREWAHRNKILAARDVECGVRRLMESEEGAEVRRRAAELGGAVREATPAEGGPARSEWDTFISHVTR